MNTAIAITALICGALFANSVVTALRDIAQAKHAANRCPNCGHDNKENSA